MTKEFTKKALVDRARAQLLGAKTVPADRRNIVRRQRLGEQPDEGWPGAYVDNNAVARRLREASEKG